MEDSGKYYDLHGRIRLLEGEVIESVCVMSKLDSNVMPYYIIKVLYECGMFDESVDMKLYDLMKDIESLESELVDIEGQCRI